MKKDAGFTLIEVVAVLAIIALIAGGVFAGRSLVRTSQMQSVIGEYQNYTTAIHNFRSKYHAMPGDFSDAQTKFGAASTCTNGKIASTDITGVCNGNGDGYVDFSASSVTEHITAWRHLGSSGFISGTFSGAAVSGAVCADSSDTRAGENIPASKLKAAGWNVGVNRIGSNYSVGDATAHFPMNAAIDLPLKHALWLGGAFQRDVVATQGCARSQVPVLTGDEAYQIDLKNDDGNVATGRIRGQFNSAEYSSCNGGAAATGNYNRTATGVNCALVFMID